MDHYPLVLVEWLDHTEEGPDWCEIDDVSHYIAVCFSVGWVLAESDTTLTLVPHLAFEENEEVPTGTSSAIKIAKGAIRRRIAISFRSEKN